jgi:hypothetical protein
MQIFLLAKMMKFGVLGFRKRVGQDRMEDRTPSKTLLKLTKYGIEGTCL